MPDTIAAETFDNERLPNFLRPQEHQVIFKDARGVVYPCSRAAEMHGVQGIDPDADAPILRETLRSTYRFGTSPPRGFHHDAQFEYGRHFDKTRFDCSQKGACFVSGSHAEQGGGEDRQNRQHKEGKLSVAAVKLLELMQGGTATC